MATEESKGGGLTGMDWHEKEMYYFFKYFLKFFFNLLFGWSYLSLTVTEDCLQKKNLIKYIDLLKDLI